VPLSRNLGTLTSWNPLGLSRPAMELLYLYHNGTRWVAPHDRPAASVIAQQHSSANFVSLRFQFCKVTTFGAFQNCSSFIVCTSLQVRHNGTAYVDKRLYYSLLARTCETRLQFRHRPPVAVAHVQLSSAQLGFQRLTVGDTSAAVDARSDQCELA